MAGVFATPLEGPPRYTIVPSPVGELALVGDGESITGIFMQPVIGADWVRDPGLFIALADQLDAYFAGELRIFDVPLAPRGTSFQLTVWRELLTVLYGETTTYGALAMAIGRPTAARAVGMANGRNPISIILPCHRVIGADGSLTGYGGGLPIKRSLLALESGS